MNNSEEIRAKLNLLIQPLFSYWEHINLQERREIKIESSFEKNLKKKAFDLFQMNNHKIKSLIEKLPYDGNKFVLRLIYDKVRKETVSYHNEDYFSLDSSYDYFSLMIKFKELLNQ